MVMVVIELKTLELVTLCLWHGRKPYPVDFEISHVEYLTLLGREECEEVELITFHGSIETNKNKAQPL